MKQAGISVRTSYHECSPSKCSPIAKLFRYAEVRYSPQIDQWATKITKPLKLTIWNF